MTITLIKLETAVIWRSTTAGQKTTSIPGSTALNDGYELVVKTAENNGDFHTIVPTSGTIAGKSSLQMVDFGGSAHFLSDGAHHDWVSVCLCTNIPQAVFFRAILRGGFVGVNDTSQVTHPGVMTSSVTPHFASASPDVPTPYQIKVDMSLFDTDSKIPSRLVAVVYTECLPPPTPVSAAPTVTSVTDNHGLTWQRRSAYTANLPGPLRRQNINFETWWADSTSLADGDNVQVTANFSGTSYVPNIIVRGYYNAGDWDPHPSLPAALVSTTGNNLPSFNIGTSGAQSEIFIYYVTSAAAAFPVADETIDLFVNPLFSDLFSLAGGFFNLNQDPITHQVAVNSAALEAKTNSGEGVTGSGSPSSLTFPTDPGLTWNYYGFGNSVPNRRVVITDSARAHWFICNQSGITGMSEPVWNTTAQGANTIDGTVTWTYLGTSFFVAPYYTSVPVWTEPGIGGGHFVRDKTLCRDSTGTYVFAAGLTAFNFGITGLTEPVWNTSALHALTTDGTVTWVFDGVYMGTGAQELLVVVDAIDIN